MESPPGRLHLTFDDGPDPVWTPRLLDVLAAADARATFFPIAGRVAAQPGLIGRIVEAGHVIGLHCHEHVRHSTQTRSWGEADTTQALRLLASVGVRPSLWRTPWGDLASWSEPLARQNHLRIVPWTADTHDWRGDSAEEMLRATEPAFGDGAIILAHDGIGPGALRADAAQTVRYTSLVIDRARTADLRLEALSA